MPENLLMNINKKIGAIILTLVLGVGIFVGVLASDSFKQSALADSDNKIDKETLSELYEAIFDRPLDQGANFHVGKNLRQILKDIINSDEKKYYAALFKAVKAYEEALRAPGTLSDADKQSYLGAIDSAMAALLAWVETLPDQDICKRTVGPEHAREMILKNIEKLESKGKKVNFGLLNAYNRIGGPKDINIAKHKCATPTPSASPTATPTPTPTASPTPTPSPKLTLRKIVVNDNGGTAASTSWTLSADGPVDISGVTGGAAVTNQVVATGSYNLSESGGPTGYSASAWSCTGGNQNDSDTVTLAAGQNVTCTITNNDIQPRLTLVKNVVNDNSGAKVVADFPLFVGATQVVSGVENGFNAGNYTVSETQQTGYTTPGWGGDCALNGSITLNVGDDKTCTITNNDVAN